MQNYGLTKSSIKPQPIEFDEYNVWVNSDIKKINENIGQDNEFIGFQFNMVKYSKDEFIKLQAENQKNLIERINNTQLALCEIYESLGGVK